MSRIPLTNVLVLSAALFIGAGPFLVKAAGRRAEQGSVASVDIQRVYAESDARKTAESNVLAFGQKTKRHFDEIAAMQYLTEQEITDYNEALLKEKPTDVDTKRMADIKLQSAKRVEEQEKLASTKDADLTPANKTRLRELNTILQDEAKMLDVLKQYYQRMVNDEDAKQMRQGLAEVRAIVGKLAKDQGFTQVFDTSALVYAPTDLTAQAIQKATKKP